MHGHEFLAFDQGLNHPPRWLIFVAVFPCPVSGVSLPQRCNLLVDAWRRAKTDIKTSLIFNGLRRFSLLCMIIFGKIPRSLITKIPQIFLHFYPTPLSVFPYPVLPNPSCFPKLCLKQTPWNILPDKQAGHNPCQRHEQKIVPSSWLMYWRR